MESIAMDNQSIMNPSRRGCMNFHVMNFPNIDASMYGNHRHHLMPLYSSLPPLHNHSASLQPPLLPLPTPYASKHAIMQGKKNGNYKQLGGQRKKTISRSLKPLTERGCRELDESIYSLSPPPSSLPMPSLALMRPRIPKVSQAPEFAVKINVM